MIITKKNLKVVRLEALPQDLDRTAFLESFMGMQFILQHDLKTEETFLIVNDDFNGDVMRSAFPGSEFSRVDKKYVWHGKKLCLVIFSANEHKDTFDFAYKLFRGFDYSLLVSFAPVGQEYVRAFKERIERRISKKEVRLTRSTSARMSDGTETSSAQMDVYYKSDEKNALLKMLDVLNSSMLSNGTAYKVAIVINPEDKLLYSYLRSRLLIIDEFELRSDTFAELFSELGQTDAIPFDNYSASMMLGFSPNIKTRTVISTPRSGLQEDIPLGNYLDGSNYETREIVGINSGTLNLGAMITGLPGTGKTVAAMSIAKSCLKSGPQTIVISPTEEWDRFGIDNKLYVIKLYDSKIPINFFKSDAGINTERFYENLAMLMAAASDAGPYTDSLEKCLLAAFSKVYRTTNAPDPIEVYEEIEEAIIDQHARRTNTGVRYTKHGENVRAALENLRLMLSRPEFAFPDGVDFADLLSNGVVFDLSRISNKMKPFFYALILNQAYGMADSLDPRGDGGLRLLMCLEEAHLIFGREERSAATADLKQRIQDFRKKGVGLMLITHNVTDIEPSIRRLCQTKLYFRQSSDIAKFAADDLIFKEDDKEAVIERLKTLEQRVCALNLIEKHGSETSVSGSVFVRVSSYQDNGKNAIDRSKKLESHDLGKTSVRIKVIDLEGKAKADVRFEVWYVGERIHYGKTSAEGVAEIDGMIKGKRYRLIMFGEKRKDSKKFEIVSDQDNNIIV